MEAARYIKQDNKASVAKACVGRRGHTKQGMTNSDGEGEEVLKGMRGEGP